MGGYKQVGISVPESQSTCFPTERGHCFVGICNGFFQASHDLGKNKRTDEAPLWVCAGSCMQNRPPPCPLLIVPLGALSSSAAMIARAPPPPPQNTCTKPVYQTRPSLPASPRAGRFWQSPLGYCWDGCRGEGFSPPSGTLVTMVTMGNCWRLPATCWAVWMPRAWRGPTVQACGPLGSSLCEQQEKGRQMQHQSPRPLQSKGPWVRGQGHRTGDTSPVP